MATKKGLLAVILMGSPILWWIPLIDVVYEVWGYYSWVNVFRYSTPVMIICCISGIMLALLIDRKEKKEYEKNTANFHDMLRPY